MTTEMPEVTPTVDNDVAESSSRFLALAKKFNNFHLKNGQATCKPFVIAGFQIGLLLPNVLEQLTNYPDVFHIYKETVELNPTLCDYTERSNVLDKILRDWRERELFVTLKGWREECFEVTSAHDTPGLLKMERSATCLFGVRQFGVTISGYVRHPAKGLCLWLQRRSLTKETWPGMLDNMVGGGLSVGYDVLGTALKEAEEEASVPDYLLKDLRPAGSVTFLFTSERGIFPNTEFIFDLELPHSFTPTNRDGEVDSFHLLSVDECIEKVLSPEFKTTSCPAVLDFLIRHGIITAESEPSLTEINHLLHLPLQSMYRQLGTSNGK